MFKKVKKLKGSYKATSAYPRSYIIAAYIVLGVAVYGFVSILVDIKNLIG